MRKTINGFTIVEMLVVIAVIGILTTITMFSYASIQSNARDNQRSSNITVIAEALEKYYDKNGEYPTCSGVLDQTPTTVTTNTLVGTDPTVLAVPKATSGTNSITCNDLAAGSNSDVFSYTINGTNFVLKYREEATGTIKSVTGRHSYTNPIGIATGNDHTCAISITLKVYCWGYNGTMGELGNNSAVDSKVPVAVNTGSGLGTKTIKSIAGGLDHTCVIASDGLAYCWGEGASGRLGNNGTADSKVPVQVSMPGGLSTKTALQITAADTHSCMIASDNLPYCWGQNSDNGQVGDNTVTNRLVPTAVSTGALAGKTVKAIAAGGYHTCVIASDNKVYCWGDNSFGQLGDNTTIDKHVPTAVQAGDLGSKTVVYISVGKYHSCAISSDHQAYCWGADNFGQLGDNSTTDKHVPTAVNTSGALYGKAISAITNGEGFTCAIASDHLPYCWGWNDTGRLGIGSTSPSQVTTPIAVGSGLLSGKIITALSGGNGHMCVLASTNQPYCWGNNSNGQLGNNLLTPSYLPVSITGTLP